VAGLLIAAVTYSVMMGGLRPFLFWANHDWFGASDSAWTGLLAAQGVGALIGAVVSAMFVGRLLRQMSYQRLNSTTLSSRDSVPYDSLSRRMITGDGDGRGGQTHETGSHGSVVSPGGDPLLGRACRTAYASPGAGA
jgi:hypothetical protein